MMDWTEQSPNQKLIELQTPLDPNKLETLN
jgi:hypothetical protein